MLWFSCEAFGLRGFGINKQLAKLFAFTNEPLYACFVQKAQPHDIAFIQSTTLREVN